MTKGDPAEQRQAVARAMEAGVTYFDTAASYGRGRSEENLGRVLRELGAWGRVRVGTKVRVGMEHFPDVAKAVRESIEASLKRLQADSVDLLQLHAPVAQTSGERALAVGHVLGDVADAMDAVKRAGLARHIGFTGLGDTAPLHEVITSGRFETMQSYFNIVNASAGYAGKCSGEQDFQGVIDRAAENGVGVINIRVMAGGAIGAERHANAGDPSSPLVPGFEKDRERQRADALEAIVREAALENRYELAFRFGLSKAGVSTVLVGFSSIEQLEAAIRWADKGPLAADVIDSVLEQASR
ncbi:MAG: aldo/keto reductase [Chloroflexi bacterium]|nr:aldo/keto reductase [Chloroflexota bacterium]